MSGLKRKAYLIIIVVMLIPISVLGERMVNYGDGYIFALDGNAAVSIAGVDTESGMEAEGPGPGSDEEGFRTGETDMPGTADFDPGMNLNPVTSGGRTDDGIAVTEGSGKYDPAGGTGAENNEDPGGETAGNIYGDKRDIRDDDSVNEIRENDTGAGYNTGDEYDAGDGEGNGTNSEGSGQQTGSGVQESDLKDIDYSDSASFRIEVDLTLQKVFVFYRDTVIREMVCSGGTDAKPTPLGEFATTQKIEYAWVEKFEMGAYYWTRFFEDYLFHSVPFDKEGKLMVEEAGKLGSPASHGCIRMALDDARWLYETLPLGVRVLIYK